MAEKGKQHLFETVGVSGLKHSSGLLREEWLPDMRTLKQRISVYKEMMYNDAIVGSFLFIIDMLIRGVDWRVEPCSETDEDIDAAEFVESCLYDTTQTFEDIISEILSMLPYGWSTLEKVYKIRRGDNKDKTKSSQFSDGKIGWAKLPIRSQDSLDRWIFDEVGDVTGLTQQDPNNYCYIDIPIEKLIHFRTRSHKNSPEGMSILRTAYQSFYYKKHLERMESQGIEKDVTGIPVMRAPGDVLKNNATVRSEMEKIVRNLRMDEQAGVLLPSDVDPNNGHRQYELEVINSAGSRTVDVGDTIMRHEKRIATTVAADFLLLGQDKVGSFALSSDKTNMFANAIGCWVRNIGETFTSQGINELLRLNNMPGRCKLVGGDIEHEDTEKLGRLLQLLASTGAMIDNKQINAVLEMADLPTIDEGVEAPLQEEDIAA